MNCTPIARQVWYNTYTKKRGAFLCLKEYQTRGIHQSLNKWRWKRLSKEGLSYNEAARIYGIDGHDRIQSWERIYLTEGSEGLALERRGRGSTGRPKKLPKDVEEDLLAEVQRLRAENAYLKNLQALVLEDERRRQKKRRQSKY